MRAAAVAAAVLVLVLTSTPSRGQYGRGPDSTRASIVALLDQSPLLQPRMSVVRGAQFVRQAQVALRDVPRLRDSADRITSVEQATSWLESALSGSVVIATVTSTPTRLEVRYRRLVDTNAPMLSVVTADSVPLAPALYLFVATDPATGVQLAFVVPVAPYGADAGRHLFLVGFSLTGQGDQWARTLGHESLPALVRDIGADHIPDAWGQSYLVNAVAYSLCYLVFLVTTVAAIGTAGKKL